MTSEDLKIYSESIINEYKSISGWDNSSITIADYLLVRERAQKELELGLITHQDTKRLEPQISPEMTVIKKTERPAKRTAEKGVERNISAVDILNALAD